jgi:nucleotide-binding universal stress UspA family protein
MEAQKIVVPIDYSENSEHAIQWGASLAQKYGAQLLLLHVIPKAVEEVYPQGARSLSPIASYYEGMAPGSLPAIQQPIVIDLQEKAQTRLHSFACKSLRQPTLVQVKVAVGKPAEEILRVAREEGADMIVMGTHGRTGLRHLLLGSVAEEVTRHASCPVFTLRTDVAAA